MSAAVERRVSVDAGAAAVWAVLADLPRWPSWTPSVRALSTLSSAPWGVGTFALVRQPRLPPAVWRVTEWAPGRGFAWRSTGLGFSVLGEHWIEPKAAGCDVLLRVTFSGLLGPLLARLAGGTTAEYMALEAAGLKKAAEAR